MSKARSRIPSEYSVYTFFSQKDDWSYVAIMDDRTCVACREMDWIGQFNGLHLRRYFPYLEVRDESVIEAHVHPNCRCELQRDRELWSGIDTELQDPALELQVDTTLEGGSLEKKVRDTLARMPEPMTRLIDNVYVYPSSKAPEFTFPDGSKGTYAASWTPKERNIRIYGDNATARTDEVIAHETGHAVYTDQGEQLKTDTEAYNRLIDETIQDMKADGAPWFKWEKPEWKGRSIEQTISLMRLQQRRDQEKQGLLMYRTFHTAAKDEPAPSEYAGRWRGSDLYETECFGEITYFMLASDPDVRRLSEEKFGRKNPRMLKAWKEIMRKYGWDG